MVGTFRTKQHPVDAVLRAAHRVQLTQQVRVLIRIPGRTRPIIDRHMGRQPIGQPTRQRRTHLSNRLRATVRDVSQHLGNVLHRRRIMPSRARHLRVLGHHRRLVRIANMHAQQHRQTPGRGELHSGHRGRRHHNRRPGPSQRPGHRGTDRNVNRSLPAPAQRSWTPRADQDRRQTHAHSGPGRCRTPPDQPTSHPDPRRGGTCRRIGDSAVTQYADPAIR